MLPLIKYPKYQYFLFILFIFFSSNVFAQTDTLSRPIVVDSLSKVASPSTDRKIDSVLRTHSPRKAAIRSAILPGLGQAYNKKYWKIPIVYAAIGIPAVLFIDNLKWYNRTRFAYRILVANDQSQFGNVHPQLKPLIDRGDENGLRYYRDQFRRNVDYSVLFFILFWGLNVVDATVDAHLKSFDVSPDLSFRFKAGYSDLAGMNGVGIVLVFK